ncbi:MAG: hypothetical protein Q8P61_02090, partial [Candidatus Nanopelagicales bacterium]|nr:hypothetical protein [Candidatus Nanopelagicales bacterium]
MSAVVTRSRWFARKKGVRTASDAVDRMLVDVTTVLAGAWLVSIGLSLPSSDAGLAVPLAGWLVLAATSVAWFLSLLLRVTPRWVFIATAGIGLLILTASTSPEYWSGAGPVMVTWAKMYAVCSAPLLQERKAVAVIVGMGMALAVTILIAGVTVLGLGGLTLRGGLFAVVSSVALGMATVGVVGALRRVGRASDDAAIEAQDALAAEAHEQARRDEADRFAAVTHDGLINTLGAVARGSGERNRSLTIERCRADAIEMRSFLSAERPQGPIGDQPHTGFVGEVTKFARGRAGLLGLELTVAVEARAIAIPHRVSEAICSIVGEALINVSKHSGVCHATLTIAGGVDWVLIEIMDEGNGFDPATRGNPQGIANRCERLGIGLAIETVPGSGTLVRLEWRASESDVSIESAATGAPPLLERARRRMVRQLCWWFLGLFVAQTLASWGLAPVAGNLVALALIIPACLVGVRWADLGKPLPPGASLYLVLVAGLVTYSSGAGAIGCARLEISWWGGTAGFLCLVLLVLLSSGGWFAAGAVSFVLGAAAVSWELGMQEASHGPSACGPGSVPPLLVEVVVVLVGIWLMQPLMARHARAALGWRLEAGRARRRTARQAAWDEIRRRRGDRALGSTLVLL